MALEKVLDASGEIQKSLINLSELFIDEKVNMMRDATLQTLMNHNDALLKLIGRKVRYLGHFYEITDLLLDEDTMILSADSDTDLQEDSYGRAHRRVPKIQHLRFRDATHQPTQLWEDISFLDGPLTLG